MRIGRVRIHLIDNHFETERVGTLQQPIKIVQRPENRVYIAIIGHVIAEILHGRGEERRDPDAIHPKGRDMVETLCDAVQISNAVPIRVLV